MEKFELNGKSINVTFDFATMLEIEDEFNLPYNEVLSQVENESPASLYSLKFLHCCVRACNEDTPKLKEWLHDIPDIDTYKLLNNAFYTALGKFFKLSPMEASETEENQKDEGNKKNG